MNTLVSLAQDGGRGATIRVEVAPTPEAEAAAVAFFRRSGGVQDGKWVGGTYTVASFLPEDVEEGESGEPGPILMDYFFPTCEHGMSLSLCMGPDHFPSAEQERALWG